MSTKTYNNKPSEVQAIQFNGSEESFEEIVNFIGTKSNIFFHPLGEYIIPVIRTSKGLQEVHQNDYVVKSVNGEISVVNSDVFESSFEVNGVSVFSC